MLTTTYYRDPDRRSFLPVRLWRKVPSRPRDTRIGSPTLLETTYDEKILESLENVQTLISRGSPKPAGLGLTMSAHPAYGLPTPPFRSLEPSTDLSDRHLSTASSVYSQPSPEFHEDIIDTYAYRPSSSIYSEQEPQPSHTDISPPDSPEEDVHREWRGSPNISPIEEEPSETEQDYPMPSKPKSNIPILKKFQEGDVLKAVKSGQSASGWRTKAVDPANGTKWDTYSGEPTDSENGKKSQIRPGSDALQQLANSNKLAFRFQKGPQETRESIAERRSRLKMANSSSPVSDEDPSEDNKQGVTRKPISRTQAAEEDIIITLPEREPWRGASGRSTIVNPVSNNPAARTQPLASLPRPNRRPVPDQNAGMEAGQVRTTSTVKEVASAPSGIDDHEAIKPIAPLKAGRNNSPRGVSFPASPAKTSHAVSSPTSVHASSPAAAPVRSPSSIYSDVNKPLPTPTETSETRPETRRKSVGTKESKMTEAEFRSQLRPMAIENEPSSRFSATTYATTHYDSLPGTPRMSTDTQPPPMPVMPPEQPLYAPRQPIFSTPSSVINRKRPVPSNVDRGTPPMTSSPIFTSDSPPVTLAPRRATIRKPTPSQVSRSSVYSTDGLDPKPLPQSPPELQAPDRITALQARLDNLQRRRHNVQTIIKELTQVIQPSSVAYDKASRAEVKSTVESLNSELADIGKEEHEVGLKLHRAWKKRDQESCWDGESGGLWVRRVTG